MADTRAVLRWDGEQRLSGGEPDAPSVVLDGRGAAGPSPMTALLMSLAGCMAIDIVDIAQKMRVEIGTLEVTAEADRNKEPPRRFTRIVLRFNVTGVAESDRAKVQRAVDLSAETYCSVHHSLRPDVGIALELVLG
jgi:putative redox protein